MRRSFFAFKIVQNLVALFRVILYNRMNVLIRGDYQMRTKEFETTAVLDKAMHVFWRQGYEQTSMQNLVDEMGIHRRSIYDTFGDKHQLFIAVLAHYHDQITATFNQIINEHSDLSSRLTAIFEAFINHPAQQPDGCLVVNTATALSTLEEDIQQLIKRYLQQEQAMLQRLLIEGQAELQPPIKSELLAATLQNALVGIRVMAKVNPDSEALIVTAHQTLQILPWKEAL